MTNTKSADKQILIVEDDSIVAAHLENILTKRGYVPVAVDSGEGAVQRAVETHPNLVLMDVHLAGEMDGVQAAKQIRAQLDIPVIYLTAYANDDLLQRAQITEPYSYLVKPVQNKELLATIEMALYKHKTEQALRQRNREMALLNQASHTFNSTLEMDQVLAIVLEQVRLLMDVIACSIWWIEPETNDLICQQATGPQNEIVRGWRLSPGEGIAGATVSGGKSLIVPDALIDARYFAGVDQQTGLALRSILSVPLKVKENVIGVLQAVDTQVDYFESGNLTLLEPLAASAATAIENARLFAQAQQDISERKQTEKKLRESEKRFRSLFAQSNDAVFIHTLDGKILDVNHRACEMLGYTKNELVQLSIAALHPADELDRSKWAFQATLEKGSVRFESRFQTADGTPIVVDVSSSIVDREQGLVQGIVRDITERKQAEEGQRKALAEALHATLALQESEHYLQEAQSIAHLGHWKLDIETQEVSGSDELFRIFGLSSEKATLDAFVQVVHPDDREYDLYHIRRGIEHGEPWNIEHRLVCKDGTQKVVHAIGEAVTDETGKIRLLVGTVQDITERKRAEKTLRESEKRYHAIIEDQVELVERFTPDGKITFVNEAFCRYFGKTRAELLGVDFLSIVPEQDRPMVKQRIATTINPDDPVTTGENRVITADGTEHWMQWSNRAIFDEQDNIVEFQSVGSDITERVRAEKELEYQLELENLVSGIAANFINLSVGEIDIGINKAIKKIAEFAGAVRGSVFLLSNDLETITNTHEWCLDPSDSQIALLENISVETFGHYMELLQRLENVVVCCLDNMPADAHGEREWAATHGFRALLFVPMVLEGALYGALGFYGNIGKEQNWPVELVLLLKFVSTIFVNALERKRAEEERDQLLVQIQEQARQMQQIVDTVPEGVVLLDANGRIVLANPVADDDLTVLADAQVGDTLTHLGDRLLAELLTSPTKGLWHTAKVDDRTFQVIARPMENGPNPESWVLVINDVTQEREIQQRIQQQERLAAVGQLAAGIAHDFNNVMAAIVLYAQITMRDPESAHHIRERMKMINQQANHASDLIRQILDFSRRAVLERHSLDLLPLLKEQTQLFEHTLPENIAIRLGYGRDKYMVNADLTSMQQIMINLAVNARDAMPGGGILRFGLKRIKVETHQIPLPEMKAGDWIQLTVSDTGIGISSDVLPHIFDPFFTTKLPDEGTGLGLAQVHGIVGLHEGAIDVKSQVGKGTTFTIYLPALPLHSSAPTDTVPLEMQTVNKGTGETILVVEDNAATRKALVTSLKMLNYRVLEASNGHKALEVLELHNDEIALVMSDVVMPSMGGIALFHALKQRDLKMPVMLLTGHPMEKELEDLRAQGLSGWLLKPPNLKPLAEMVARVLRESSIDL
ncbi:MAG: PAS domain S-box protein [Proteobacteria bacterium]|nr:PAS domain S-box protein [Pseudomonadota bacterium]